MIFNPLSTDTLDEEAFCVLCDLDVQLSILPPYALL